MLSIVFQDLQSIIDWNCIKVEIIELEICQSTNYPHPLTPNLERDMSQKMQATGIIYRFQIQLPVLMYVVIILPSA